MWDQSYDTNQMGASPTPTQQPNYLMPSQKQQMQQYANSLMSNQGGVPAKTWGSGLAEMGKAAMGGYLDARANPQRQSVFSGMFGNTPQQSTTGDPMQLASANGGPPSSIFSGLFGGN